MCDRFLEGSLSAIALENLQQRPHSFRRDTEEVKLRTLGNLTNTFLLFADYDTDYFADKLKKIVAERNKLVHHYVE